MALRNATTDKSGLDVGGVEAGDGVAGG